MSHSIGPKKAAFATVVALLISTEISALTISLLKDITNMTYSIDGSVQKTTTLRITNNSYIGSFCVVFTLTGLAPVRTPTPGLGLYNADNSPATQLALDGSHAAAADVISGDFPIGSGKNAKLNFTLAAIIAADPLPPPDSYVASIRADLYEGTYSSLGALTDTLTFMVSFDVGSHLDLSLDSFTTTPAGATLAFDPMFENAPQSVSLFVRSNAGYSISMRSTNVGAMANTTNPALLIDYDMTLAGSPVQFTDTNYKVVLSGQSATTLTPQEYLLEVTIPTFATEPASGDYSDTVTILLAAP